jgi:hypothetical protein
MVRAILDGRKTETRRLLKPQPGAGVEEPHHFVRAVDKRYWISQIRIADTQRGVETFMAGKSFKVGTVEGDRLWVREAWRTNKELDSWSPRDLSIEHPVRYEADGTVHEAIRRLPRGRTMVPLSWREPGRLRPAMYLPRWASRLTLHVKHVRVERLQAIGLAGAIAEGCEVRQFWLAAADTQERRDAVGRHVYEELWSRINGPESWRANPWVVVTSFEAEQINIDRARGHA